MWVNSNYVIAPSNRLKQSNTISHSHSASLSLLSSRLLYHCSHPAFSITAKIHPSCISMFSLTPSFRSLLSLTLSFISVLSLTPSSLSVLSLTPIVSISVQTLYNLFQSSVSLPSSKSVLSLTLPSLSVLSLTLPCLSVLSLTMSSLSVLSLTMSSLSVASVTLSSQSLNFLFLKRFSNATALTTGPKITSH